MGFCNFKANFNAFVNFSASKKFANFCSSRKNSSCNAIASAFFSSVTSLQIINKESLPPLTK
jgi:hypothetical protein